MHKDRRWECVLGKEMGDCLPSVLCKTFAEHSPLPLWDTVEPLVFLMLPVGDEGEEEVECLALGLGGSAGPHGLGHVAAGWSCLPSFLFPTPLPTFYL